MPVERRFSPVAIVQQRHRKSHVSGSELAHSARLKIALCVGVREL
jgi:hypothetical protein